MEFFLTKPIHISLDAMGGDYAPDIIINGASQAKLRYPNLIFSFFGDNLNFAHFFY